MTKLAVYAANPEATLGRRFEEPASPLRNAFQRDRDRIIHSTAFRRLEYKTQVFVNHEGDLFRTRLTQNVNYSTVSEGTPSQSASFGIPSFAVLTYGPDKLS